MGTSKTGVVATDHMTGFYRRAVRFYDLTDVARECGLGETSPELSWRLRARLYAVAAFGDYECGEK